MRSLDTTGCEVHVCVCTHARPAGPEPALPACAQVGGEALFFRLKERALAEGVAARTWITRTGCLGFCNAVGTTVAIYRRGASPEWLGEVQADDFEALWSRIAAGRQRR